MFGVAGVFRQPDGAHLVRVMADRIAHRGPDALRALSGPSGPMHLAHRRLSIIDLSAAADQPFEAGGLHLSYNGELYNFRELRSELERLGVPTSTSTSTDTEAVLEAWRAWGTRALGRFRGMFAIEMRLPHLRRVQFPSAREAISSADTAIVSTADPAVIDELRGALLRRIVDLNGRLGADMEALPGYEGIGWAS